MSDKYQITAYNYNTRKQGSKKCVDSDWPEPIPRLLAKQHTFLPLSYEPNGYLFRGMSHGFLEAINHRTFGQFNDHNPHSAMEKELELVFVSHELSDALTCARPWESEEDCVVLMIKSEIFVQENENKHAAMLAFSEPGFIFKYPFFIRALLLDEIAYFVVNSTTEQSLAHEAPSVFKILKNRWLVIDSTQLEQPKRARYEHRLKELMIERDIKPASPVKCEHFPG